MADSLTIFAILIALIFLGIPVAVSIGLASLATIYIFDLGVPLTLLPSQTFSGVDSFPLMAIPFFIFAGEIMNKAGITRRILDLADAIVGSLKGGLTYVNVVAAMMMASISGSGTACAAALGVSLIPDMASRGYSKEYAVSLTSCANVVGPIIPPSTLLILFGYYTNTSVAELFMGGVLPGFLIGIALMIVGTVICRKKGFRQEKAPFSGEKLKRAVIRGWAALLIPAAIFLSIIMGWTTASEAGAIVCVLSLILGACYSTITKFSDIMEVARGAANSTCTIFALLALSGIFANVLVRAHFQEVVADILFSLGGSPTVTLLVIVAFIFVLGMVVDVTPMVIMFAATFTAIASDIGVDKVHFGVVFTLICMIGAVTPPVGGILFVTTTIGKVPMTRLVPTLTPLVLTLFAVASALVFFPSIVTALPNLLF
ncbi:TRAP transporter large permease [Shumkonia mesophila]|uniref:TRAP transporter large permease n=1 Tax=Shumkonia mesophila TaxID=2838854 RepID=UPI0029344A51|nr:TRAP transporter large permease [Shumkonia mesophila]